MAVNPSTPKPIECQKCGRIQREILWSYKHDEWVCRDCHLQDARGLQRTEPEDDELANFTKLISVDLQENANYKSEQGKNS